MDQLGDLFQLILVDPMTNGLIALARLCGGNFGIAIIVFTIIMRIATWPLTASQYKQSKKMQEIQPRMAELQKKYKGKDPKKMQQEQMALYREVGFNPLGCLFPLLIQMPIWIALYQVIRQTLGETPESYVGLSQQLYPIEYIQTAIPFETGFLFWNLGKPDGSLFLPVIVAATAYVQQKMITPAPNATTSAQQQQTQQMMTWMMPLMFGFWSLSVPSGLALYWGISNIISIVLQYFYMGRKVDWKGMLTLNMGPAPAPTPAARANKPTPKATRAADPEPDDDGPDNSLDDSGAPVMVTSGTRRKRHGKRRGKR